MRYMSLKNHPLPLPRILSAATVRYVNVLTCVGAVSLLDVKELPVEVVDLEKADELAHG